MTEFSPGDIVEIRTGKGFVYVHVTHDHPSYPPVVNVLTGIHKIRPADMQALVQQGARVTAMVPLKGALEKIGLQYSLVKQAEFIGANYQFPTFRTPIRNKQGEIVYWWFWDGFGLTYETELTPEQSTMPLREIMSPDRFLSVLQAEDS